MTYSINIDRRRPLADGSFPVKVCFSFKENRWKQKYFTTGISTTLEVWELFSKKSKSEKAKELHRSLYPFFSKADKILENKVLSVLELERLWRGGEPGTNLKGLFEQISKSMLAAGRVGSAGVYSTASGSFEDFDKGASISSVTIKWLDRYRAHMRKAEKSVTTTAIYLRALRKVFNDAVAAKLISADLYPFGRRKFVIQEEGARKRALTVAQKDKLLECSGRARDFWAFSYFCNGMSFGDIAHLKVGDLQDGVLYFNRRKTINTSRILRKIEIPLRDEAKQVIARHGSRSLAPKDYLFPILDKDLTPSQIKDRIHDFIAEINTGLKELDLKFPFALTTYTARHTFANIAMQKGADKSFIQEALGHSSMKTTESYISGFDLETKRKISEKL